MPLLRFDLVEGRSPEEVTSLLDAAHRAMVQAFGVPESDRYQVVHQHPAHELVLEDTGLGFARTAKRVVLQVITLPRRREMKVAFYEGLCRELDASCGIGSSDVVVNMVTVSAAGERSS